MILIRQGIAMLVLLHARQPGFPCAVDNLKRKLFLILTKNTTVSQSTKWAPSVYIQCNVVFLTGYQGLFKLWFKYSFLLCTRHSDTIMPLIHPNRVPQTPFFIIIHRLRYAHIYHIVRNFHKNRASFMENMLLHKPYIDRF